MTIRLAEPGEYADVLKHYEICGYNGGLNESDLVVVAVAEDIAGAVRICAENEVKVLRGMQIKPEFRQKGLGASMLLYLKDHIEMKGCYCLPYKHLVNFYVKIGFEEVPRQDAPGFLAARLERYLSGGGRDLIIMQIKK